MENKKRWRHRAAPEAIEAWIPAIAGCRLREHIREMEKSGFPGQRPLVTEPWPLLAHLRPE